MTKRCQNTMSMISKKNDVGIKDLREILKNAGHDASGSVADLRRRCENCVPPMPAKKKHKKLLKGHVSVNIGTIEVLYGRG